jgi:hypothetical protein
VTELTESQKSNNTNDKINGNGNKRETENKNRINGRELKRNKINGIDGIRRKRE